MYFPKENKIVLVELTVPFETNIEKSRQRKCERYEQLVNDIKAAGFMCNLVCVEVGSRGVITKENKNQLHKLQNRVKLRSVKEFLQQLSILFLISAYVIFNARNEPVWTDMSLLS